MTSSFPLLPKDFEGDPELVAMHRATALEAINRTLRMSEIRCASFDEMLARIEHLWDDPYADEIVYRFSTEPLTENQYFALAESIRRLADEADGLPSPKKASVDRAIKRMLASMPAKAAAPVAEQWLEHKRKFRREIAYKILRVCGLTSGSGTTLLSVFNRTGDQECLRLIARFPIALAHVDVPSVMKLIEDDYWRMRLVQSAIMFDKSKAMLLANSYPVEFIHAIGRLKDETALPRIAEIFKANHDDLRVISIYAWALGQIKDINALMELKKHIEKLVSKI